jgi:hypothetical protein
MFEPMSVRCPTPLPLVCCNQTEGPDTSGRTPLNERVLPVSDCAPKILSNFSANLMIPIDRGEGAHPNPATEPRVVPSYESFFSQESDSWFGR